MIRQHLKETFTTLFETSPFSGDEPVVIEPPKNPEWGDFATPLAFTLARRLKRAPKQIAEDLADYFNAESAGAWTVEPMNGFLNITLADDGLFKLFSSLSTTPHVFPAVSGQTNLEYVSANPTGPLHIGHGRWAVIGSVLANLLKYVGTDVSQEFYVNDAGNQIALFRESVAAAKAGEDIPENGYHGAYIATLTEADDPLTAMLTAQKKTLAAVGVTFDTWFSEKTLHESGVIQQTLDDLLESGDAYKSEGAIWFKSSKYGDEKDRVLVKSDGATTYFLADIAYHADKLGRGFDRLINIWGADHHGYVPRVSAAIQSLTHKDPSPLTVVIGQLVSLKRDGQPVRMSKRTGEMITLDEVVEEIGADATRYFLIHKGQDTPLDFDLDLAKKKSSENPVFYIQYAHARLCTVLAKLGDASADDTTPVSLDDRALEPKERALFLYGLQLYDELWLASQNLNPAKVAHYAFDLAKHFHHFYEACPVMKAEPSVQAQRRVMLIQTRFILQTCLDILGISAPESM